jgi:hypothetical protein
LWKTISLVIRKEEEEIQDRTSKQEDHQADNSLISYSENIREDPAEKNHEYSDKENGGRKCRFQTKDEL